MTWIAPSARQYILGRGKVYWRAEGETTWQPIFNCKSFKVNVSSETVQHKSLENKLVVQDKSVTTGMSAKGSLITDCISVENLKLFLLGTKTAQSQSEITLTAASYTVDTPDEFQELQDTGVTMKDITVTSITDDTAPTPVALIEHVDYEADWKNGMFCPLSISTHGIAAVGDVFKITGTAAAKSWSTINAGEEPKVGHIMFIGDQACGNYQNVRGYCTLSPSGDYEGINENTFIEMTINIEFMAKTGYESNCGLEVDVLGAV